MKTPHFHRFTVTVCASTAGQMNPGQLTPWEAPGKMVKQQIVNTGIGWSQV